MRSALAIFVSCVSLFGCAEICYDEDPNCSIEDGEAVCSEGYRIDESSSPSSRRCVDSEALQHAQR